MQAKQAVEIFCNLRLYIEENLDLTRHKMTSLVLANAWNTTLHHYKLRKWCKSIKIPNLFTFAVPYNASFLKEHHELQ